ncbi:MAG: recombinase family protein, partial [Bradyrhizobium sp.]
MYGAGTSPRSIAATLNADGIPSPGSKWKRVVRRKSGRLASAIHGDVKRGSGILNNQRYVGVVTWGRAHWKRGAADSSKRRMSMNGKALHEAHDERLRIVPQELWERVKGRQRQQSQSIGKLVKGGLRRRAGGAGRPGKYLFTGLLVCDACDASFVLRNRDYYACASHWNGAACSNGINVSRALVQDILLAGIKKDLRDEEVVAEIERRFRAALRQSNQPKADYGKRIAELGREIENLADAVASGLLKSSPALATRLQVAEKELARLQGTQTKPRVAPLAVNVRKRILSMVDGLDGILMRDPERGRQELRGILGDRIRLQP